MARTADLPAARLPSQQYCPLYGVASGYGARRLEGVGHNRLWGENIKRRLHIHRG